MTEIKNNKDYHHLIDTIDETYQKAKNNVITAVNSEMLMAYWKIGKYIVDFELSEEDKKKFIVVALNDLKVTKYLPNFKRISKPGQRIYVGSKDIKKSKNGKGIFIVSTPK